MPTATVTKNGMIHLPDAIRRKFNLKPGDRIEFIELGNEVVVVPVRDLFDLTNAEEAKFARKMIEELKSEHLAEN